jgi:hypothetical protein
LPLALPLLSLSSSSSSPSTLLSVANSYNDRSLGLGTHSLPYPWPTGLYRR